MGQFMTNDTWGKFPHDVRETVQAFTLGKIGVVEALGRCAQHYASVADQVYSYAPNGDKVAHTVIRFGSPVRFEFVFK